MLADKRRVRLVLLISGVLIASPVLAQSAGELRLQAKQVAAEIATQKAGGTLDVAAQQRAIERLGASREGVLRRHLRLPDGFVRDTVYYSILADEWPAVKARLEASLSR